MKNIYEYSMRMIDSNNYICNCTLTWVMTKQISLSQHHIVVWYRIHGHLLCPSKQSAVIFLSIKTIKRFNL